jgi:molecular chaperone DnaK (HSP70)
MSNCPKCRKWDIRKDDMFCSFCGLKLLDLEIIPGKIRFYFDNDKKCTHKEKIVFNNKGWMDVAVKSITYDKSIFRFSSEIDVVHQSDKKELEIELINPKQIATGSYSTITIEFGNEKHYINAEFYDAPRWNLNLDGEAVKGLDPLNPLKVYKSDGDTRVGFKLQKLGQSVFDVTDAYLEGNEKDKRYKVEIISSGEDGAEGIFTIHSDKDSKFQDKEYVEFKITGKYTGYQAKFPFYYSIAKPPSFLLVINGERCKEERKNYIDVYEGLENEFEVKIVNLGNETLTIKRLDVAPPFETQIFGTDFPKELTGGSDLSLILKLDAGKIQGGAVESSIKIITQEVKEKKIDFYIEKKILEEFKGILAADIGTTNTTIAYRSDSQTAFVPLEINPDIERAGISPSVILYEKIIDRVPEKYSIGETAKERTIYNPRSSVESIKTKLGETEKIRIFPLDERTGPVDYSPTEISYHMIKRLKEITENRLKKKITKIVITHPTKFTHIQIDQLKKAFNDAGIEVAEAIEESEAVAIDYIVRNKKERTGSYVIGVFDCGGGTTDITMLEVFETRNNNNVRKIDVNVLASDGDRNFGGNNMTGTIENIIVKKIQNKMFTLKRDASLDIKDLRLYFKEEDEKNLDMMRSMAQKEIEWEVTVRVNRVRLNQYAEDWKINLSNAEKAQLEGAMALNFVNTANELKSIEFSLVIERSEFEEKINNKILEFIDKMKRMVEKTGKEFDTIILSGMSSQIPLIQQLFNDNFGDIIKMPKDLNLKKCVALGALEYYDKTHNPGYIILNFKRGKKLGSAWGIKITAPDGRDKFLEVFSLGAQIPTPPEKITLPFIIRRMNITVFKNLGTHEYVELAPNEFEEIKQFNIMIPDEISDDNLDNSELFMEINDDLVPKLSLKHGNIFKEYI